MPREEDINNFNDSIDENHLADLSLIGRRFMWSRLVGAYMSRLDRFLLFENFCEAWNGVSQWILERSLFDHCHVLLFDVMDD